MKLRADGPTRQWQRDASGDYVLVESLALLQARLGVAAAVKLAKDASAFAFNPDFQSAGFHLFGEA